MEKEKYSLEYVFDKASRNTLWPRVSTPLGLSEWFADEVNEINDRLYSFVWDRHPAEAEVTGTNQNTFIRFHWMEDANPASYFEFRLYKNELTGGLVLEITDFAEPNEKEDAIALWDSQITVLRRLLGIL